jgi:diguanylate cyclase (GGDEF)-like protein
MGALYFFPVTVHGRLDAILRIEDRALDEGDLQIVTGFCKQAGLSIENYRLREDLQKKFKHFAALSELTQTIASMQNDKALLQVILDKSAELLKAEQGSLMMLDSEADVLLVEARKGVGSGIREEVRITRGAGIAGKVVELGEPLLVENLENDPRIMQKNRQHYKTPSFVSVPLKVDNRVIGVLNLADKDCGGAFNEDDLKLMQSLATQVAVIIERNLFLNKTEELKKLIITDDLTGLLNRRYLYERLKDELARSERHTHELSLLMLDLDGFKHCNDTHGHLEGDRALKEIAKTLLKTVRSIDIVVRFGGDEFMIILPETGQSTAIDIADRLRRNVAIQTKSDPCPLTISIGIACYPEHGRTSELLVKTVDTALYRAKYKGKDCIEVFSGHVV